MTDSANPHNLHPSSRTLRANTMDNAMDMDVMERPIGVFDSGVGGLSVLDALRRIMPREHFVYFGDTAWMPYGSKSAQDVRHRAQQIMRWLVQTHQVKTMVVACNTVASILQSEEDSSLLAIPCLDPIGPTAHWVARRNDVPQGQRFSKIGILATQNTVNYEAYPKALQRAGVEAEIRQVAADELAPLIEQGKSDSPACSQILESYLAPLVEWGMDALIFGCTHYPHVYRQVDEMLPPGVWVLDPAQFVAHEAVNVAMQQGLSRELKRGMEGRNRGTVRYFVSGSPQQFLETASQLPLPDLELCLPEHCPLEDGVQQPCSTP